MKTKNTFSKFSMQSSALAIIVTAFFGFYGSILALVSIVLSIKGIIDYKKDNSIGGFSGAVVSLLISIVILFLLISKII